MEFELSSSDELLELKTQGILDNESAAHFRDVIDQAIRDGWHRILVRMGEVTYLSSAGIGALLTAKKRLADLRGFFGICDLTPEIERVLKQTRVLDGLRCDPAVVLADVPTGTMTRMSKMRVASRDGVELQIYPLGDEAGSIVRAPTMACRTYGEPQPLQANKTGRADIHEVTFPRTTIGLGLGALGDDFEKCKHRLGEFLAVAGAAAQSPTSGGGLPDYSMTRGEFVPQVQVVYGVRCQGEFSHLIRFNGHDHDQPVPLSAVVQAAMHSIDCAAAGIVVLGECAGLVGTQLRKSPALAAASKAAEPGAASDRFGFPGIREWLSFSAEQIHRRSLALVGGVAVSADAKGFTGIEPFLRPCDRDGRLTGHFHAAVFPYRPLKKRTLDLSKSVAELFEWGSIQDVVHLLRDDRPINGAGESEFISGACWIAPLKDSREEAA